MKISNFISLVLIPVFAILINGACLANQNIEPDLNKLSLNDTTQIKETLDLLISQVEMNPMGSMASLQLLLNKISNYPFSPVQETKWKYRINVALMKASDQTGQMKEAILYGEKAIAEAEKIRMYSEAQGLRVEVGQYYFESGEKLKALYLFYQALNNWDGEIPSAYETQAYLGIAKVHFEQGNFGDADKSLNEALKQLPNENLSANIFEYQGLIKYKNQLYLEALELLSKALALNEKNDNSERLGSNYYHIGNVFFNLGRLQKAESFYEIAIHNYNAFGTSLDQLNCYKQMMLLKMKQGNLDEALKFGELARSNTSFKDNLEIQESVFLAFSDIFSKREMHKEALGYYQQYSDVLKEKIKRKQNEDINEFRVKYEMEKKERELEELNNQKRLSELAYQQRIADDRKEKNMLFTFGVLMFVIILMGAVLLFNFQRQIDSNKTIAQKTEEINRVKIKELEKSLRLESANAMLKGQEIERNRIAKDLHDSVGALLSSIKLHFESIRDHIRHQNGIVVYEKTNQLIDEACYEVRNISHDMMPGSLIRFGLIPALQDYTSKLKSGKKLSVDIIDFGIPEHLDDSISLNAYRIVQELLNNVIKHSGAHEVLVQLTVKDKQLNIMVEDDGKGFDVDLARQNGIGLKNIISRVNYLNGQIHFDSEKGKGTNIMIDFPLAS